MAKWYGIVGIADNIETEPGFYEDGIMEKHYQGDVISTRWRRQTADRINDDITLAKQISIIADQYALYHYSAIAYVEYMGTKWKVTEVEPQFPRLILTVGGVWNGNTAGSTE